MFRKVTVGLIAAASLGIVVLAPGSASANGLHVGFGLRGWGYGGPGLYINTGIRAARRSKGVNGDSKRPRGRC